MNFAILGAGAIATTMATTLQPLKGITCYAVAARDKKRAQTFADKFGFTKAYGSYTEMLMDEGVDIVYIATPHSHHYEHIKMCIEHHKHVLCEKAFTANARQAEEVIRMAEERGLFLGEAMWTRFMPMRQTINDILASGIIGKPTSLSANLGYPLEHKDRLVKLELAGGALLDLGVYVLNFASMVFGDELEGISANCIKHESGVDAQETIMLTYQDGKMATLYATMLAQTDRRGIINGTNGYIEIENINNYESVRVYNLERRVIAEYAAPCQVTGYEYEVQAAVEAVKHGQLECPQMPHVETIRMMQLMDVIRESWGIVFPFERPNANAAGDMTGRKEAESRGRVREIRKEGQLDTTPVHEKTEAQAADKQTDKEEQSADAVKAEPKEEENSKTEASKSEGTESTPSEKESAEPESAIEKPAEAAEEPVEENAEEKQEEMTDAVSEENVSEDEEPPKKGDVFERSISILEKILKGEN